MQILSYLSLKLLLAYGRQSLRFLGPRLWSKLSKEERDYVLELWQLLGQ